MAALDTIFTDHPVLEAVAPVSGTCFVSAVRTATPAPAIFATPVDAEGLLVVIDVTVASGTGVTFTIEGVDRVSGKTWVILTSTAKTGAGTTLLRVSPNIATSANLIAQDVLPAEVIIRAAHSDGASLTYSVGVHFTA